MQSEPSSQVPAPVLLRFGLYLIFTLSGGAGLIYESLWARHLGLFVGHSAYAQIVVLAIFLGGMSLGAIWVGSRSENVRDPLQLYARIELAIGLIGCAFHPIFLWVSQASYETIFSALGSGSVLLVVKWCVSALLIPQFRLLPCRRSK